MSEFKQFEELADGVIAERCGGLLIAASQSDDADARESRNGDGRIYLFDGWEWEIVARFRPSGGIWRELIVHDGIASIGDDARCSILSRVRVESGVGIPVKPVEEP